MRGKEATEILYRLLEEIRKTHKQKRGWHMQAFSLDVEKAFDSVWHNGIKFKISKLGLPPTISRLLSSFLQDRKVRVRVKECFSSPVSLLAGDPKGCLEPFAVYNFCKRHPSRQ